MNILVANDDGINEVGIAILAKALMKYGDVYVCAPDSGRSAASHSIKLLKPMTFEPVNLIEGVKAYQTSGTPADCIRIANSVLNVKFDIVFSGINNGLNLGTDIIYSGTVAAAREAHIAYIPSVAISVDRDSFDIAKNEIDNLLSIIFNKKLYSIEYTLNINFPTSEFKTSNGIKFARQGIKRFKTEFNLNSDGLYLESSSKIKYDNDPDTDVYLASKGYITMVPLMVNQTNMDAFDIMKKTHDF